MPEEHFPDSGGEDTVYHIRPLDALLHWAKLRVEVANDMLKSAQEEYYSCMIELDTASAQLHDLGRELGVK